MNPKVKTNLLLTGIPFYFCSILRVLAQPSPIGPPEAILPPAAIMPAETPDYSAPPGIPMEATSLVVPELPNLAQDVPEPNYGEATSDRPSPIAADPVVKQPNSFAEPESLLALTEPQGYQRLATYTQYSDPVPAVPAVPAPARQVKFVAYQKVPEPPPPQQALSFTVVPLPSKLRLNIFPQTQEDMLYPLKFPAFITSLFGWRSHPITGERKFHSGLDLGAQEGSPVVAVYHGRVISAKWMGGYGNAVLIEHPGYRTLYAHLSKILVKPGPVQQGMVIGAVGSTGFSTGPHLHFELQKRIGNEWTPIDPGEKMKVALKYLMDKATRLTRK